MQINLHMVPNSQQQQQELEYQMQMDQSILEDSQAMDEAIGILSDPMALSMTLKEQYEQVKDRNQSQLGVKVENDDNEPRKPIQAEYLMEPDDEEEELVDDETEPASTLRENSSEQNEGNGVQWPS